MCERKAWTKEEDQLLGRLVGQGCREMGNGRPRWNDIASKISQLGVGRVRKGKQCRQRWFNQLHPAINREAEWTTSEETQLFHLQALHGNRWARIARALPGRSDNNIKNYFYSTLRKALRRVNNYVTSHKHATPYRNLKAFQTTTLNKILTVAENKADRKLILGKQNAAQLAKEIRDALIRLQTTTEEALGGGRDGGMDELVGKIQDFNRVCKRRKSKKKDEISSQDVQGDSASGELEASRNQSLAPTQHKSHAHQSINSHRLQDPHQMSLPHKKPLRGRQLGSEERIGLGIKQVESEPLTQAKAVRQPIIPFISSSNSLSLPTPLTLDNPNTSHPLPYDPPSLQQVPMVKKESSSSLSFIPFMHHCMGSAFIPTNFFPRPIFSLEQQQMDGGLKWAIEERQNQFQDTYGIQGDKGRPTRSDNNNL